MARHARLPRHLPGRARTAALTVLAALCTATGVTWAGAPRPEPLGAPIKEPDYKLTASAGLAGHARLGWVPVYVAIDARRDFDGDLVVRLRDQFAATSARGSLFEARRSLKLAAGSKTEYHVYIRHDTPSLNQAVVEVFLESGKPIRDTLQGLGVQLAGRGDYLLCVVSDKPNLLRTLAQRRTASGNVYNPSGKQERQFSVAQNPAHNTSRPIPRCRTPLRVINSLDMRVRGQAHAARWRACMAIAAIDVSVPPTTSSSMRPKCALESAFSIQSRLLCPLMESV